MRSSTDALRSLKKYVARALPGWEVRLTFEEGTFSRPSARVGFAGPELSSGPAHTIDVARPFNVLCHPPEAASGDAALLEAEAAAHTLRRLFEVGITWVEPGDPADPNSPPVTNRGHAWRVPLWNWDGVPLHGTVAQRFDRDYLRVMQLSVDVIPDPADDLLVAATCDIRLAWRRPGVIHEGPPMQGIVVRPAPEPPEPDTHLDVYLGVDTEAP